MKGGNEALARPPATEETRQAIPRASYGHGMMKVRT